jgi:hypothetical protein
MGSWKDVGIAAAKLAVNVGIGYAAGRFVEKQLNKLIKKTIISVLVKQVLFIVAVIIPTLSLGYFLGKNISLFVSSVMILALLAHSVIKLVPKIWGFPYGLVKMFLESGGPSAFLANYIYSIHPWLFQAKSALDEKLSGWVPSADALVSYVWSYVGKQLIIFIVSLALFFASFTFLVRPVLLNEFLGISGLKLYLVPFAMSADYIFGTNFMVYLQG